MPMLMRAIETRWLHEMQMLPGARHRHVEEPALLVDLIGLAGCHVRWNASIHEIENKDCVPFLSLGGMNGRQD
jgi:hypothetical protein